MPSLEELTRNISNRIIYRNASLVRKSTETEERQDESKSDTSFILISNNNQT